MRSAYMRTVMHLGIATALMLLAAFGATNAEEHGSASHQKPCSIVPLLIQGRITAVAGKTLTIKPPDAYPGAEAGVHAQLVIAAPPLRVDISHARILFADGKEEDRRSFAVGEHVVVVLDNLRFGSPLPGKVPNASRLSLAYVVERIETGDKIVTH